jgi:hypothetical protein
MMNQSKNTSESERISFYQLKIPRIKSNCDMCGREMLKKNLERHKRMKHSNSSGSSGQMDAGQKLRPSSD